MLPRLGLLITDDTVLCPGDYFIPAQGNGVLIIAVDNVVLDCNSAHIRGLNDGGLGIIVDRHKNISIKNCFIDSYFIGIDVVNSNNLAIFNNVISTGSLGLHSDKNSNNLSIFNNTFNDFSTGILAEETHQLSIFNNKISDVFGDSGIEIDLLNNAAVYNNTFFNVSNRGISLGTTTNFSIFNNLIYDSEVYYAIDLYDASDGAIFNNKIYDISHEIYYGVSGISASNLNNSQIYENYIFNSSRYGIYLSNSYNTAIYDNSVEKSFAGLKIYGAYGGLANNYISGNRFVSNVYGIDVSQSNGNDLKDNFVCQNQQFDVFNSRAMENNKGAGNTCDKTVDWKDEGVEDGCTFACTQDVNPPVITNATSVPTQ